MEWDAQQEQLAETKVRENSSSVMSTEDTGTCIYVHVYSFNYFMLKT